MLKEIKELQREWNGPYQELDCGIFEFSIKENEKKIESLRSNPIWNYFFEWTPSSIKFRIPIFTGYYVITDRMRMWGFGNETKKWLFCEDFKDIDLTKGFLLHKNKMDAFDYHSYLPDQKLYFVELYGDTDIAYKQAAKYIRLRYEIKKPNFDEYFIPPIFKDDNWKKYDDKIKWGKINGFIVNLSHKKFGDNYTSPLIRSNIDKFCNILFPEDDGTVIAKIFKCNNKHGTTLDSIRRYFYFTNSIIQDENGNHLKLTDKCDDKPIFINGFKLND